MMVTLCETNVMQICNFMIIGSRMFQGVNRYTLLISVDRIHAINVNYLDIWMCVYKVVSIYFFIRNYDSSTIVYHYPF